MVQILLVDDHPVFRLGMARTIQEKGPEIEIHEAGTIRQALEILSDISIDLAFIDISLKNESGITLCKTISDRFPLVLSVILSMHEEKAYVRQAYEAGARGYILKDSPIELLSTILSSFPDLEAFITHPALHIPETSSKDPQLTSYLSLTAREQEIFALLARGLNYKEIAYALKISSKTASVHRYNIIQKMGLGDQASIIRSAFSLGILSQAELIQGPNDER
ncbi:MAG: response regulator transcription factor [Spirochaetales bacterium]|nr:response regulator transcription factor [Spirochaetales bacterium]